MMWLIVIVRLNRAAPRHRRRVANDLKAAGAVGISEGVWAIPDTAFHRAAVTACTRRAEDAGGDLVVLTTVDETSPTHDVLETALRERLTAEADVLARRYEDWTGTARSSDERLYHADTGRVLTELKQEAHRLARRNVLNLREVASVVERICTGDARVRC